MLEPAIKFPTHLLRGGLLILTSVFCFTSLASPVITNVVPDTGPTAGGTQVVLTGSNLGTSGALDIGSFQCSVSAWTTSQINMTTPAGAGTNLAITINGQYAGASFSYLPPILYSASPATLPTAGQSGCILTGVNFWTNGVVMFGGNVCQIQSWANNQITFTIPPGQGTGIPVTVTVAGQTSGAIECSYLPPSLGSANWTNLPTTGGTEITIHGSNFSTNGLATLGGVPMQVVSWTNTQIVCLSPPGAGTENLMVTVGGQSSGPISVTYDIPMISSVYPTNLSTAGGDTMVIRGANFWTNAMVTVGEQPCAVQSCSDGEIVCTSPAGCGTAAVVSVIVASQTSLPNTTVNYGAPYITQASPSLFSTAGNSTFTIFGGNFCANGGTQVTLGGSPCSTISVSNNEIICTAPTGQGVNLPLVVTEDGVSSSNFPCSYLPPAITAVTQATNGQQTIVISGSNFGMSGTVTIGGVNAPITGAGFSETTITCFLPTAPTNQTVPLIVTCSGQSATNSYTFSPPMLTSITPAVFSSSGGTLDLFGYYFGAQTGTVTVGGSTCSITGWGDTHITCSVPPLTQQISPVVVYRGAISSAQNLFITCTPGITNFSPQSFNTAGGQAMTISGTNFFGTCSVQMAGAVATVNSVTSNAIHCVSAAGEGTNRQLVVTINSTALPPLTFSYLPPAVVSVLPDTAATAGGDVLTILGNNFGTDAQATINGNPCPNVGPVSSTHFQCQAPPGAGSGTLVVTVGGQTSNPLSFAYEAPQIISLSPASSPTSGGGLLLVNGTNFSTSGTLTIGPFAVSNILNWTQQQISCIVPPGQGSNLMVSVVVGGQTNTSPILFSYLPNTLCLPGTYSASGCQPGVPAPAGYYIPGYGATNPIPASPGYYVPTVGATNQTLVPAGTYAPVLGMQQSIILGDANGDGIVSQGDLDAVLSNYWQNSPWVTMTNFTEITNGIYQFALTNANSWDFSVQLSTNLSGTNWNALGAAYPVYQFADTNTASSRFYRLHWP